MLRILLRGIAALFFTGFVVATAHASELFAWRTCMSYLNSPLLLFIPPPLKKSIDTRLVVECRSAKVKEKTTMILLLGQESNSFDESALATVAGAHDYKLSLHFSSSSFGKENIYELRPMTASSPRYLLIRGLFVQYRTVRYPLTIVIRGRFNTMTTDAEVSEFLAKAPSDMNIVP